MLAPWSGSPQRHADAIFQGEVRETLGEWGGSGREERERRGVYFKAIFQSGRPRLTLQETGFSRSLKS